NPENKIPISGYVGRDSEIIAIIHNNNDLVACPNDFNASDIKAIRIASQAMEPVFYEGWILYYSTNANITFEPREGLQVPYNKGKIEENFSAFIGKPCIVKLSDNRLMLRTLKRGSKADLYNLISYNCDDIIDAKVEWAAKIVFIKT
ncbi:MAG: hypothetical protein WCJ33_05260, partial [Pseudomonadota bacterium]